MAFWLGVGVGFVGAVVVMGLVTLRVLLVFGRGVVRGYNEEIARQQQAAYVVDDSLSTLYRPRMH